MWSFASNAIAGSIGPKPKSTRLAPSDHNCTDEDDSSSCASRDEGLECPICCESFNIVENVPYVLWCGHTLCKNCVFGLQWAVVKFPSVPVRLPPFIACPWCHLLSVRIVYKGHLSFPRKNFFLLWMVDSMNGDRPKPRPSVRGDRQPGWASGGDGDHHNVRRVPHVDSDRATGCGVLGSPMFSCLNVERIKASLRNSLAFFVNMTAKFPLVVVFLLIVLYAIPASVAILAMYVLITVLFALPSFLVLYFAYPSLDWLVREIVT